MTSMLFPVLGWYLRTFPSGVPPPINLQSEASDRLLFLDAQLIMEIYDGSLTGSPFC